MNSSARRNALWASLLHLTGIGMFSSALGQSQEFSAGLKFEVASVKPAEFADPFYAAGFAYSAALSPCVMGKVVVSGTHVSLTRVGICEIIRIAYNLKSFQVFGVPSALGYSSQEKQRPTPTRVSGIPMKEPSTLFYDIQARSPGTEPPNTEQVREMLRALLSERFNLKLRREWRLLAFYALVPLDSGPKLKPPATDCRPTRSSDFIQLCELSTEQLAHFLNDKADRPVVDMTYISGSFDVRIPIDNGNDDLSAIAASIRKNLGLRIEARRDQVEVVVVDHVEKPSAN